MRLPECVQLLDQDGVVVARLPAEIDLSNARLVLEELYAALSNSSRGLVVDLSGVTYIDSRGIQLLLELAERLTTARLPLRFIVPDPSLIKRLLVLTHVDTIISLDTTVEAAVAQIRGI
jgi:anti-anti-sigma factor